MADRFDTEDGEGGAPTGTMKAAGGAPGPGPATWDGNVTPEDSAITAPTVWVDADGSARTGHPGTVVGGRFVLLRELGQGGMGSVYEAEDQVFGRRVALKLLHRDYVSPKDAGRRFRREARAAARLSHVNVVVIHDFGQRRDGTWFIVQEMLKGVDLRRHLERHGRLPYPEAVEIVLPIMGAVLHAHRMSVIHRDIKPENIFLAETNFGVVTPKLIDFGIALAPHTMTARASTSRMGFVGTLCYMSPEQAKGEEQDDERVGFQADVWATGIVLFELLYGRPPFYSPNWVHIMRRLLSEEPVPRVSSLVDGVPGELCDIVERALTRKLDERYADMESFLRAMLGFARRHLPAMVERLTSSLPRYMDSTPPPPGGEDAAEDVDLQPVPSIAFRPLGQLDVEGQVDPFGATSADLDLAARAEEDLRVNALEDAIQHAARAISGSAGAREVVGRMRLVQAVAGRWLGRFVEAEQWAREALDRLPRGGAPWYEALGHLAQACGYMGKNEGLPALAEDLLHLEGRACVAEHIMASNRLVIPLVRAGRVDLAQKLFDQAQERLAVISIDSQDVVAWTDVGNAELDLHRGDLVKYLQLLDTAIGGFVKVGAVRDACLQRSHVGYGYLRLGLYAMAEQTLRKVVLVGEPMRLNFIAPARANLALALARIGDLDQAFEVVSAALDQCTRQGNRRFEAIALIYRVEIFELRGDDAAAYASARRAVAAAATPAIRAYALGALAGALLRRGDVAEAEKTAAEAMDVVVENQGVEAGEALIRLVHALAIEAGGDAARAAVHAREAKRRLDEQAMKITNPGWRKSFLEDVPEHARTIALSARL